MQSGIFREEDVSAEGYFRKGVAEQRTIFWGGRTFEERCGQVRVSVEGKREEKKGRKKRRHLPLRTKEGRGRHTGRHTGHGETATH